MRSALREWQRIKRGALSGAVYERTALATRMRAILYYQTVPPYYQLQRATDATGADTERLVRFFSKLDVTGTSVDKWVLKIDADEFDVN